MKIVFIIIALLFISLNLNAGKNIIKFYLQDGTSNQHKIEDITEMNFLKSYSLDAMQIFLKDTNYFYLITNIKSITFRDSTTLKIYLSVTSKNFKIADIDSIVFIPNTCSEVTIGTQIWSCKNLDVDHYRNGDPIPQVTDSTEWSKLTTGAWCYYNNDPTNGKFYGKLYNWYAVTDQRGLAPVGWHIPSNEECWTLEEYLGGQNQAGGKLKATGTYQVGDGLWITPNEGATNESGFSALPGGNRTEDGGFWGINTYGSWLNTSQEVLGLAMTNANAELYTIGPDKRPGQSVRCIKGEAIVPVIISITPNPAFCEDEVTIRGTDFGITQGYSHVSFDSRHPLKSDYISWCDTAITVKVPYFATTGKVIVTVNGQDSKEFDFTVKPNVPGDCKFISIGSQEWTCKNLDVDHYRNGDPIPQVTDSTEWNNLKTGAWCYYNNDPANGEIYGKLYNWYAVNDPRGLAPKGWHIPNDGEWKTIERNIGMSQSQADSVGYRGKNEGTQLKETGTEHWRSPNTGATDEKGFSALPGSYRGNKGAFYTLGKDAYWWCSNEKNANEAWFRGLNYYYDAIYRNSNNKEYGFSVRCVRGEVSALAINSIIPDETYIGYEITLNGSGFGQYRNYSYVTFNSSKPRQSDYLFWSDTKIKVKVPTGATSGKIFVTVNDFVSNELNFTVKPVIPNNCEPVTIGSQTWSCKNLDVSTYRNGDKIPQVTDPAVWSKLETGAWCYYDNNPAIGELYGKLYNWYAVKDPRGLAPVGWHIPSDEEWTILSDYLGGDSVAGGKLKSTGTYENGNGLWKSPNTGATNESGFSALPGGICQGMSFWNYGGLGSWWSATKKSYSFAWCRAMNYNTNILTRKESSKVFGLSVRCIKD